MLLFEISKIVRYPETVEKTINESVTKTAVTLRSLMSFMNLSFYGVLIYNEVIGLLDERSISYTSSLQPKAHKPDGDISAIWCEYQLGEKNKLYSGNESTLSKSILIYIFLV